MSAFLGGFGGASLGQAVLKLRTDDKGYRKGLNEAEGDARTFGRRSAIAVGAGAAGFALLTGAVVKSISAFAQAGDEVQKMSQRTGFSTEALSELRHAAELSGTSLDGLETGIRRMQRTVFDAASGLKEAERALGELGLTAQDLERLSPEEQFRRITTELAGVENAGTRAALAQIVFGRSGTALLPMLSQGAEGLAAMRQEAHDLGVVFDQEAADKAAQFNDDVTRLNASLRAVGFVAAEAAVPIVGALATGLTGLIQGFSALPGPVQQSVLVLGTMATTAPLLAVAFSQIGPAALAAAAGIRTMNLALLTSPVALAALAAGLVIGIGLLTLFGDASEDAAEQQIDHARIAGLVRDRTVEALQDELDSARELQAGLEAVGGARQDQIDGAKREVATLELAIEQKVLLVQTEEQIEQSMRDATAATRDQTQSLRELTAAAIAAQLAMDILDSGAFAPGGADSPLLQQQFSQLRETFAREGEINKIARELLDSLEAEFGETEDEVKQFGSSASDAADEIKELEQATKALVDAERARADELHARSTSNLDKLLRAAQEGANRGINVDNVLEAIAREEALAAGAAQDLARLDPDDPRHQPTASLINYGHIDVHTTDLPDQGAALEELIP